MTHEWRNHRLISAVRDRHSSPSQPRTAHNEHRFVITFASSPSELLNIQIPNPLELRSTLSFTLSALKQAERFAMRSLTYTFSFEGETSYRVRNRFGSIKYMKILFYGYRYLSLTLFCILVDGDTLYG
ncbi:unnamed protein product [Albugo candida]|uniref:Uncharacterized protein n=1 Tax=Albugo candida TaxID=65357 RepID=A0A024GHN4_9STRA|nr:unnamed protein product [Albugo candida]|eukprot:CCI46221.1 unnamed protein product [Albugo candida]